MCGVICCWCRCFHLEVWRPFFLPNNFLSPFGKMLRDTKRILITAFVANNHSIIYWPHFFLSDCYKSARATFQQMTMNSTSSPIPMKGSESNRKGIKSLKNQIFRPGVSSFRNSSVIVYTFSPCLRSEAFANRQALPTCSRRAKHLSILLVCDSIIPASFVLQTVRPVYARDKQSD